MSILLHISLVAHNQLRCRDLADVESSWCFGRYLDRSRPDRDEDALYFFNPAWSDG